MKANRIKRMIAASGLLMALVLTATGCQVAANPNGSKNVPIEAPVVPKVKLADAPVVVGAEFRPSGLVTDKHFTEAEEAKIKETGLAALKIMIEDHPEYTVEGFTPTLETWSKEIAPKLQPLVLPSEWKSMTEAWMRIPAGDVKLTDASNYRANPILTNKPEIMSGRGLEYELTGWKSDAGETCTSSDKPYEYDVKAFKLSSQMAQDNTIYPIVGVQMDVYVHCKEGGTLKSLVDYNVAMKRNNGQFPITAIGLMKTSSGSAVIAK
jgi:hypothetical protein